MMSDWKSFWDSAHSIYVSARHKDVHYRDVAEQMAALVEGPQTRALDYGSGEATHADLVAARVRLLCLCDSAPSTRAALARRFGAGSKIKVSSPEELEHLGDSSFDLIVANSVIQYLNPDEFDHVLKLWRRLLDPGGKLVLADVIPPNVGPLSDAMALLRYAARKRFLLAAFVGLIRTALSPYRKLRATLGIRCYTEAEAMARLRAAGFRPERLAKNIEHNPRRMTFLARPS